ncbi:MAG: FHA domain-containing protein [Myxococcaceae bacterium]
MNTNAFQPASAGTSPVSPTPDPGSQTAVLARMLLAGAAPPPQEPHLLCIAGQNATAVFPLSEGTLTIGRMLEADIRLCDRAVSRHHADIVPVDDGWCIRDVGSPNGVYVNGEPVLLEHRLAPGDIVRLGETRLVFRALEPHTPVETPLGAVFQAPANAPGQPPLVWRVASVVVGISLAASALMALT